MGLRGSVGQSFTSVVSFSRTLPEFWFKICFLHTNIILSKKYEDTKESCQFFFAGSTQTRLTQLRL